MARELLKTKNDEQVEKVIGFIAEGSAYAVKVDDVEGGFCDDRIFIEGTVFYDSMAEIVDCLRMGNDSKYTIGQFTGLQDCKGNDIYEGDILKVYYYGKSKLFGVVKFGESRFYIDDNFMRDSLKSKAPMAEMLSRYDFEVIGNVVDNPELLKGGEK